MPSDSSDLSFMQAALALARRGLGRVAPNPAVGCVIVQAGRIVGRGWTQPGGRPHAEAEALARAGAQAKGATVYVTLEPCAHQGQTPSCAQALIDAGVGRAVVALRDPDGRVNGRGVEMLRQAGIPVDLGLFGEAAAELNAGFLIRTTAGRPLVTLKLATSLDGRIAMAGGESRWITGEAARRQAHLLRATHDAVMVGSGTALADDPRLDVRLEGLEARVPLRIVLDGRLRLPPTHDLVARASRQPTLLVTVTSATAERLDPYRVDGVEIDQVVQADNGSLSLPRVLAHLADRGLTRVLVEGGGILAAGLLRAGLVDRIVWFRAPILLGGDGRPAVAALEFEHLADCSAFLRVRAQAAGEDLMEIYRRIV